MKRQSLQKCGLTESVHKRLKKSAREPSCTSRFDSGTAQSECGHQDRACHLLVFKKDKVFPKRFGLREWFSAKCFVTLFFFILFKVQFKWSWLALTQQLSHVYVAEGCFLEQCFGSTLKSIWFPVCDHVRDVFMRHHPEPQRTHRKLFAERPSWGFVVQFMFGMSMLLGGDCYCDSQAQISFKKTAKSNYRNSTRAWKAETELETKK